MSMLRDAIKNEVKITASTKTNFGEQLVIEQTLNKLFYLPAKPKEELLMIKSQYEQKKGDRYGLHASSIIASEKDFCCREQVLSLFYKQVQGENISVGLKRIFEEGNFVGEKWQRLFIRGELGNYLDMDRSCFLDKYDLSYTPDAIITIAKKKYVVEIKSMNTFQFKKATTHPSGMKQLRFYMLLTKIHKGFVLVEDKNDQNFKIFTAEHKMADVAEYIERLKLIQEHKQSLIKNKKMVKGICSDKDCKRALKCNMRPACFGLPGGRVKLVKSN